MITEQLVMLMSAYLPGAVFCIWCWVWSQVVKLKIITHILQNTGMGQSGEEKNTYGNCGHFLCADRLASMNYNQYVMTEPQKEETWSSCINARGFSRLSTVEHWDHLKEIKKNMKELPYTYTRSILMKRHRKKIKNRSLKINYIL